MNEEYHERCAEMLSQLRHALKMTLGKFCDDHQDSQYLDDDVIIAAAASLLCEMLVDVNAEFVYRLTTEGLSMILSLTLFFKGERNA